MPSSTSWDCLASSTLPGSVSGAELEAYFRAADVFVMASDHEGFCVPLAEAMGHGVPIVAYGVAAVPETVGGAGLVLPDKSAVPFAAAVGRVLARRELREVLAAAGGRGRHASTLPAPRSASSRWSNKPSAPEHLGAQPRLPAPHEPDQSPDTTSAARSPAVGRSSAESRRCAATTRPARSSPSPAARTAASATA